MSSVKLALSYLSRVQYQEAWIPLARGFVTAAERLGIDIVFYTHDQSPPNDIDERIEIYRGAVWDTRRHSSAQVFIGWPEHFSDMIKWDHVFGSEDGLNSVDLIFADSPTVKIWLETITARPVIVFPVGYDGNSFNYLERNYEGEPFTFLFTGAPTDRLGAWEVPQAFELAFPKEDDVRLVIFCGGERGSFQALREQYGHDKRIVVETQRRSKEEMIKLYRGAHCFVRPALSDCVSIGALEAMATGLPIIAPRHLWFRDLLPETVAYFVRLSNTTINPAHRGFHPYEGGWRVPDLGHLAEMMRAAYENRELTREKGIAASLYVRQNLTWEANLKRMIPFFEDLLEGGEEYINFLKENPLQLYSMPRWKNV